MKTNVDPQLKKKLSDPVLYLDQGEYKALRKKKILQGTTLLAIGIACLIYMGMVPPSGGRTYPGEFYLLLAGLGLPIWGLYWLMTIKARINTNLRAQLVWLHPELKPFEEQRKKSTQKSKTPKMIVGIIIVTLLLLGLYFYIQSLVEFIRKY